MFLTDLSGITKTGFCMFKDVSCSLAVRKEVQLNLVYSWIAMLRGVGGILFGSVSVQNHT